MQKEGIDKAKEIKEKYSDDFGLVKEFNEKQQKTINDFKATNNIGVDNKKDDKDKSGYLDNILTNEEEKNTRSNGGRS